MPVFLFTIHAYRSWCPDDERGFVRRGEGILPPDVGLASAYNKNATSPRASFTPDDQTVALLVAHEACNRRDWRLHGLAMEPTHAHLLVSWVSDERANAVCGKLKNLISRELNLGRPKKQKWLSRGASRRQVRDRSHFDHLVSVYLPKHRGLVWVEGMELPKGADPSASADG